MRGGGLKRVDLDEGLVLSSARADELLALDEALENLAAVDRRKSQVVELRFFGGLSIDETAEVLKVSPGTVMRDWTLANIAHMKTQMQRLGFAFDWSREVTSCEPEYYRWNQWFFLKMHERGLAYRKEALLNWCPECATVLANEQVVNGCCWRHETTPVEQRAMRQWFLKTTAYAAELLDGMKQLEKGWPERVLAMQRNWIGRSDGAEVLFRQADLDEAIPVFTTRPDTLFGATFFVLAPEHPEVERLAAGTEHELAVREYVNESARASAEERADEEHQKTGVPLGREVVNPVNGERIPMFVADYVLMEYGTGAIMGVPGHDERDFEFATKFELPIVRVVCGEREDANTPLHKAFTECESGTLVNSGVFDGFQVDAAKKAIVELLAKGGSAKPVVHYRLHDWCISRQRYWGPPIPIIYCDSCGTVPVPEKDLPVVLPFIEDFKPDDSGVSPLARHEEWYRVECPKCGKAGRRETDVSDNFLDNSWYFLRYPSVGHDDVPFEKNVTKKWLPVNSYIGGNEHAVLHLLYSRFITMVLSDAGHLDFEEPFTRFRAHGHIIREGAKMSKTQGNIVNPDEYIEQWGADAFRMYLMFLGPYEQGGDFRDQSISGPRRFLDRLFASIQSMSGEGKPDHAVMRKLHQTIAKISLDFSGRWHFNTCIAAVMELVNEIAANESAMDAGEISLATVGEVFRNLTLLLAPFAPFLSQELWQQLGYQGAIFKMTWPEADAELAREDEIEIPVQINGKLANVVRVAAETDQETIKSAALADERIAARLAGKTIVKVIVVPGKLVNLVVK